MHAPASHSHSHASGHAHAHAHAGHSHAPANFGRAFAIGTALNIAFVAVEAFFGLRAHSTALLADAGHNLSDVFGLLLAWGAAALASRGPTLRRTYGLRSSTILAALANAVFLVFAAGAIAWEAIGRFGNPEPVAGGVVAVVAAVGIVVNASTALLFASGRKNYLNVRGAYLHMAADAGVSAAVLCAGLAIAATGWLWIDPAVSLLVVIVILFTTTGLLRDSFNLAVGGVPAHVNPTTVRGFLASLPGVTAVHDLHIWGMSTSECALTAHVVRPLLEDEDAFLLSTADALRHRFGIGHSTLQIERGHGVYACELASDAVV